MDRLYYAGYHGTSIDDARRIGQEGFRENAGPVFFAPLDNLGFAMDHGNRRASEHGDSQYGVVLASFPARELKLGLHGDQIEIPAEEIGGIVVRNVMVFETWPCGLQAPKPFTILPEEL